MESKDVLDLFDSYWFEKQIFGKNGDAVQPPRLEKTLTAPVPEIILPVPRVISRSKSEKLNFKLSPRSAFELSPNSQHSSSKLQTILSDKEVEEIEGEVAATGRLLIGEGEKKSGSKKGKKESKSKSLSELEFEEVKGFIDLGFVFSEEDKNSSLVTIIPGLQRLGKSNEGDDEQSPCNSQNDSPISRPYLSEAWEDWERRRRETPLMNWRIPALRNEIDMKENLRWWAHTVASTVR